MMVEYVNMLRRTFHLVFVVCISCFGGVASAFEPKEINCQVATLVERLFTDRHALSATIKKDLDNKVEERILHFLDQSKIYFNAKDVEEIHRIRSVVKPGSSHCRQFMQIYNLFLKKLESTLNYAEKTLKSKNFKINPNAEITLDYKKRKFAKTEQARLRKLNIFLQWQVQSRLDVADSLGEAKNKTLESYRRLLKTSKRRSQKDVVALYLRSFAGALDPHSTYFSKEFLEDFRISMSLSLEGIGAELSSKDGYTVVERLVTGGVAEKSGMIDPKDKIIAVAQGTKKKKEWVDVFEQDLSDVVRLIRGKKGTTVNLRILRREDGKSRTFDVTLVRDKISLENKAAFITYLDLKDKKGKSAKIAVINLPSFYFAENARRASLDVYKLLQEAKKKKVAGVVLDLSRNGGGSLEDAVRLTGLFMKRPIVVKQARNAEEFDKGQDLRDPDPSLVYDGPLVVLVSRSSASASEIVSAALQAYQRAVIVGGRQTFGKGTVQIVQQISPRDTRYGAAKVTVSMFFTPSGKSTQFVGVKSDIRIPDVFGLASREEDLGEKSYKYSLPAQKISAFTSPAKESWPEAKKITPLMISKLAQASNKRVKKDEGFKKLIADAKEARANNYREVWKLSELKSQQESTKKEREEEESKAQKSASNRKFQMDEYTKRPEIQEAAQIVLDLSSMMNN